MTVTSEDAARARSVVDWPAIIAGAAIAAGATVVLTGFTTAMGLGSVSAEPGEGMGMFAAILVGLFGFVTMVASYALGGYVAGRMRTRQAGVEPDEVKARDGVHGLTVWAVGTLLGAILTLGLLSGGIRAAGNAASTVVEAGGSAVGGALQGAGQVAGGVVGGVGQLAGGAISGAGQLAGGALQGVGNAAGEGGLTDMLPQGMQQNPLEYITDRLLRADAGAAPGGAAAPAGDTAATAGAPAPQTASDETLRREITGIIASVVRTGELADGDREYLIDAVAARTQLSEDEVETRVDQAVTEVQDLRAEAEQKLEEARAKAEEAMAAAKAEAEKLRAEAEQKLEETRQAAIDAAEAARSGAVWTAFFLAASSLIAGVAAFLAAIRGGQDRDTGRVWGGLISTSLPRRR
jgi:ElaB/YqjD/DUF883 family membrane-anchored ribosome-binding protein